MPPTLKYQFRLLSFYCLIGISGVAIDAGVFYLLLLIPFWQTYYLFANIISVSCGITNNFILNAFFNFRKTDRLKHRFICFFSTGILGLIFGSLIIYLLYNFFEIDILISKIVSIAFVTIIQFLLNSFVSFRDIESINHAHIDE